jgi:hypothetical protein
MAIEYDLSNCITLGDAVGECPNYTPAPGRYNCELSFAGITLPNFPSFDPMAALTDLLKMLMVLIAPLMPLFDVLSLALQIMKCVQAIPVSILSLNPTKLINCIVDLVKIGGKVLGHIPQLSLPKTIAGILCITVSSLTTILQFLKFLKCKIDDLRLAFELNLDLFDAEFSTIISCEEANIIESFGLIRQILEKILLPVEVINVLLDLAGMPTIPVPSFGNMEGPSGSVSPDGSFLDPVISILETTANGLHIALTIMPGGASMIVA